MTRPDTGCRVLASFEDRANHQIRTLPCGHSLRFYERLRGTGRKQPLTPQKDVRRSRLSSIKPTYRRRLSAWFRIGAGGWPQGWRIDFCMWSRRSFLRAAAATGPLALLPFRVSAQAYAPAYTIEGTFSLGHQGTLRAISFAPERGVVPVQCLAALLPRAAFGATILEVHERSMSHAEVVNLARRRSACVAINGGFFDFERFTPEGLLVIDGKTVSSVRSDFSGAISIDDQAMLSIVPSAFARGAKFAVQGHPVLVEPDGKMGMKSNANAMHTERSFVAQSGDMIIAGVTTPMTLYHLADSLIQYPDAFGLAQIDTAINLSGSATTGFYARLPDGSEVIRSSTWPNRDVLIFSKRT